MARFTRTMDTPPSSSWPSCSSSQEEGPSVAITLVLRTLKTLLMISSGLMRSICRQKVALPWKGDV